MCNVKIFKFYGEEEKFKLICYLIYKFFLFRILLNEGCLCKVDWYIFGYMYIKFLNFIKGKIYMIIRKYLNLVNCMCLFKMLFWG